MFYTTYNNKEIYLQLCGNCIYHIQNKKICISKELVFDIDKVLKNLDKKTLCIC